MKIPVQRTLLPELGYRKNFLSICETGVLNGVFGKKTESGFLTLSGAGTDRDLSTAQFKARMELLERFCNACAPVNPLVATADELGDLAVFDELPRLSPAEWEKDQPLQAPDRRKDRRWIPVVQLSNNDVKYLPLEYVYIYQENEFAGEGINQPISTGAAIHVSYEQAIVNGIYEVIERDAIALTWLLQIDLPRLLLPEALRPYGEAFTSPFLGESFVFDATTDLGVPVFCILTRAHHCKEISNVLMYSCHSDKDECVKKLTKEAASVRCTLVSQIHGANKYIENMDPDQFMDLEQSAAYMASLKRTEAFDFLTGSETTVSYDDIECEKFTDAKSELRYLTRKLHEQGHEIYVADITARECREAGFFAVKVTIPTLQPISFVHKNRFLGHSRVIEYARKLYGEFDESLINHLPLAFA